MPRRPVARRLLASLLMTLPACSLVVDTAGLAGGATLADATAADSATATEASAALPDASPLSQPDADAAMPSCGTLASGKDFRVEDRLRSCNEQYELVLQGDGNLVLYRLGGAGGAVWATDTYEQHVDRATMQADGDFVLYSPTAQRLFATGTGGFPGAFLAVGDDGVMTVNAGGVVRWQSRE